MLNTTVMTRFPGFTMTRALTATRLRTVTVTVTQEPEEASDPDEGDTVTLAFGLVIVKWTGPPTAVRMNVPLAGLPLAAVSTSSLGAARRVPGVGGGGGGGDGEGEGDGVGDGDRDGAVPGEDRTGAGDRDVTSDALEPASGVSVAATDACVTGPGLDRSPLTGLDAALEALDAAKSPPPSATVEAWARCWPPAISSAEVPATTTAAATAATPAAARGCRRTSCHQRGPRGMIGFGKPVWPNGPARCATLTRWARPVGVLSAHSSSTRLRRPRAD